MDTDNFIALDSIIIIMALGIIIWISFSDFFTPREIEKTEPKSLTLNQSSIQLPQVEIPKSPVTAEEEPLPEDIL